VSKSRPLAIELLVLCSLIALGAGVRIWLGPHFPNFAPVAAISLFAGYFFYRAWLAILAPWATMLISDSVLGGYEWQMMAVVYGMLTLPLVCSWGLRRVVKIEPGRPASSLFTSVLALVGCSLVSSVLFFLATNFAWLPWSTMYSHDLAGLIRCYEQGLPFFRSTLCGDLFFGCVLFGSYATAVLLGWERETSAKHALT
jgi:hypothetical protein